MRGLAINRFPASAIDISGAGGNTIVHNYLGTSTDGQTDLGNGQHGVYITGSVGNTIGGGREADHNIISGNDGRGLYDFR